MIHLSEDRNNKGTLTALRAAFTLIEPTPQVIAVLDEHLDGWKDDQNTAWTAGNVKEIDMGWIRDDGHEEYISYQWKQLLQELGAGLVDRAILDAQNKEDFDAENFDATEIVDAKSEEVNWGPPS